MSDSSRIERVKEVLKEKNEPTYRFKQFCQALFHSPALTYENIKGWPLSLRNSFNNQELLTLRLGEKIESTQTKKFLFELEDGSRIESVHMAFQEGLSSLCISTQVGCPSNCRFCATGQIGFKRQLTADEIIDQVLFVLKTGLKVDRITVMGMGEAFLNPNIWSAFDLLTGKDYLSLSPQRLSVSTVGIIPGIEKLTELYPQATLTFSLHFPFQEERDHWIPLGKAYKLNDIFQALDNHIEKTRKKTYLAYILFEGINDSDNHVKSLKTWLAKRPMAHLFHINLIPYHETSGIHIKETSRKAIYAFQHQLEKVGLSATIRQSFGNEINAACGQLAARYKSKN